MLSEVESGALFRNLQAVASGLVSNCGEVEKVFTGYFLFACHNFEGYY